MTYTFNYSKFGVQTGLGDLTGPAGTGFATDEFGNYDFQGHSVVNADDIGLVSITSASGTTIINSNLDLTNKNITNVNDVSLVSISSASGIIGVTGDLDMENNDIISCDNLQVSTLSNNATSYILSGNDMIINNQLKIRDNANNSITTGADLELESDGDINLLLTADSNNSGQEGVNIWMTCENNNRGGLIQNKYDHSMNFIAYDAFSVNSGSFTFNTAQQLNGGANSLPSLGAPATWFSISNVEIDSFKDLNMNTNDVANIDNATSNKFYVNTPTNNESQTNVVMWNGTSKELEYRTSFPNPFDQDLNTTDTPSFVGLTTDQLTFSTTPTQDDAETRLLCLNTADDVVEYRLATTILNNPFNQSLNTTDSPTFSNITINTNADLTQGNLNNVLQINNTSDNITITPQTSGYMLMGTGTNIGLQDGYLQFYNPTNPTPSVGGGFVGVVYKDGSDLAYRVGSTSYDTYRLNKSLQVYQNYTDTTTYTTTSLSYVSTGTDISYTNLPTGDYLVLFNCEMSNSSASVETRLGLVINQGSDTYVREAGNGGLSSGGRFVPFSFMYKFTNGSTTTTTFRVDMKVMNASTGSLRNYNMVVFQL